MTDTEQNWTVDLLRDEDAPGVTELFLQVYGQGYPIRHFLDPNELIKKNRSGEVISSVARTPEGRIVGHNALFNSAPWTGISETGSGVVHPDYRGGRMFYALVEHGLDKGAAKFNIQAVFGEPVCNHPFSQRLMQGVNTVIMALEVDLMPAEIYTGAGGAEGRVSAFLGFQTKVARTQNLHLPAPYEQKIKNLYIEFDDDRRTAPADPNRKPIPVECQINRQYFDFAKVARLGVVELGQDLSRALAAIETDLRSKNAMVFQVWLKLTDPAVGWAVDRLREMGYFFGGPLPRWFDDDGFLMQKVGPEPNWDGLVRWGDRAEELYDYVRADWRETTDAG